MRKEIIVHLNKTFEESAYTQNGDPRKEQIAFAQSYFAIQTRRQELLEERIALVERVRAREKLTRDIQGMKVVDNLQLYVDLRKNVLRGDKQAEHIMNVMRKELNG